MQFELPYRCLLKQSDSLEIILVGCGGTGSHLAQAIGTTLYHLADKTDIAVSATFIDGDTVEAKNIGRQRFCAAEIGRNKAETLAWRLNTAYGLKIKTITEPLTSSRYSKWFSDYGYHSGSRLMIGCVDNAAARQAIAHVVARANGSTRWLDCGNAAFNGQVLIGNCSQAKGIHSPDLDLGLWSDLPTPDWQEAGLLDSANDIDPAQACAVAVANEEQSLMVNTLTAAIAAQYLYQWVVQRELLSMATYFNGQPPLMHSRRITRSNLDLYLGGE